MTADALEAAWDAVYDATPPDWHVGEPSYHVDRDTWTLEAHHATETSAGSRDREWTADADTEVGVLLEMARALGEIGAGREPTTWRSAVRFAEPPKVNLDDAARPSILFSLLDFTTRSCAYCSLILLFATGTIVCCTLLLVRRTR